MALFEPFAPLFQLTREADRLLNDGRAIHSFLPPADVMVTGEDVTVTMDVPGLKADDLEIELVDDALTVRGERPVPATANQDERTAWQRLERAYGKFERVLYVPKGLDADRIKADMADGVLTLRIPKPEAHKPRRIRIGAGASETIETTATEQRELAGTAA